MGVRLTFAKRKTSQRLRLYELRRDTGAQNSITGEKWKQRSKEGQRAEKILAIAAERGERKKTTGRR